MPKIHAQEPTKNNPLNYSVSDIKAKSLHKQLEIITHALNIFCMEPSQSSKQSLNADLGEFKRMLDDLSQQPRKTSRFNILNKSCQLIAERVTFDQAMQYKDCTVKFCGMEA